MAVGGFVGLIAYGLMAHRFSIVDDRSAGSYLFAIASIFGVLAVTALINRAWITLALIVSGGMAFGWWFSQRAQLSTTWIYLIQHAGAHGSLAVFFGASLLPGKTPLVTRMASLLHRNSDPNRDHYTRQVTWAWTLYFIVICIASITLYLSNSMLAWSWLANILTLPLLVTMFVLEFIIRRWRLPNTEKSRLSDGWRAYQQMRAEGAGTHQRAGGTDDSGRSL